MTGGVGAGGVGRVLGGGRYVLEAPLGRGGMGAVFRAREIATGAARAIKLLHASLAVEARHVARFKREAEVTAALSHPHIVRSFEIGAEEDGTQWIVMELLEGESLASAIREAGALDTARAVRLARQILSALAAAHSIGVVHRDLKPPNVVLVRGPANEEIAKVVDFGIARFVTSETYEKLTATGQVIGTPSYMAPEQAVGRRADARADVFAVGAILHAMLTGEPPYGHGSYGDILHRLLEDHRTRLADRRPELGPLAALVDRALAASPEVRPASADAFAAELDSLDSEAKLTVAAWRPPPTLPSLVLPEEPVLDAVVEAPPTSATTLAQGAGRGDDEPTRGLAPARRRASVGSAIAFAMMLAAIVLVVLAWRTLSGTPGSPPSRERAEGTARAAASLPVAPVGATAPVVATAPTAPVEPLEDREEVGEPASEAADPPGETPTAVKHARRGARRSVVRVTFMAGGGLAFDDMREAVARTPAFQTCWPSHRAAPAFNRGQDFSVTVAADGRVVDVSIEGGSSEQFRELAPCIARILETLELPPPRTGASTTLRVGFAVFDL